VRILNIGLLGFLITQTTPTPSQQAHLRDTTAVIIETELGTIEVELYAKQAPLTVQNFLRYVDGGFYNGGIFQRTVKPDNQPGKKILIEVIQASINPAREKESFPPIKLERTNKSSLHHKNGTISMARDTPNSATSDFFICIGDQPSLDYGGRRNPDGQGFAAFGRVVKGMNVVKRIQMAPADGQKLTPPVKILSIKRKG
jgi:peptidyl-prolyl cis-trans isomerase A (cyclophilin A)